MPRLAPAAARLIAEVRAYDADTVGEPHGDPDGYGVIRAVRFADAEWLKEVMDLIADQDERIDSVTGKKNIVVTFVADVRADFPNPDFGVDAIGDVLFLPDDDQDAEQDEPDGGSEDEQDTGSQDGEPGETEG